LNELMAWNSPLHAAEPSPASVLVQMRTVSQAATTLCTDSVMRASVMSTWRMSPRLSTSRSARATSWRRRPRRLDNNSTTSDDTVM
jgi:hypothetical protein